MRASTASRPSAGCASVKVCDARGLGAFARAEIAAAGAILGYLELTQKGLLPRLDRPSRLEPRAAMLIDPATRRSLELQASLGGGRDGSLLAAIDRTVTNAGGRLLAERLAAPLAKPEPIRERLDRSSVWSRQRAPRPGAEALAPARTRPCPRPAGAGARRSTRPARRGPGSDQAGQLRETIAGSRRWRPGDGARPHDD